jgi:hypothetical protein
MKLGETEYTRVIVVYVFYVVWLCMTVVCFDNMIARS